MATSVKMREADKGRLDRLQTRLSARLGKRVTQEVLLARLVALGEEHLDSLAGEGPAPTKETLTRLMSLPTHTGIATKEEEIDQTLYGNSA